ncbi:MAG: amidohydrolase [Halanaerobiales bacterium]|nr:amidohydrolase [Halanaerobiales bacterium]
MIKNKLFINAKSLKTNKDIALYTEDGYIKNIGAKKDLLSKVSKDRKVIDLNGQYLMSSFTDGHLHYFYYALKKENVDLKGIKTIKEVISKIKNKVSKSNKKDWITVSNWDEEQFPGSDNMDRHFLDKISENVPILVKRRCLHMAFVNSKALQIAKIDQNTPDPDGGKIIKDKFGLPTGALQDQSITQIDDLVLENYKENFREIIENSFDSFLKYGITNLHTDDFWQKKYRDEIFNSYLSLAKEAKLPIDITLQLRVSNKEDFDYHLNLREKLSNVKSLKTGPVKFMLDGSLGGRTAALRKHYTDHTTKKGELLFKAEKLKKLIDTAYKLDFQPAVHAIGIKAVDLVVKIYEKMNQKYPEKNLRPIIVHASMIDDKLLNKIKKNNIVLSIQPTFISSDYKMADKRLGKKRVKYLYRMKSLIEQGIHLAASSDAPVEDINPLYGVYASIKRKDPNLSNDASWQPNEIIGIKKALELYTKGPHYQDFTENIQGVIKVGYKADFITFNHNLLEIEPERLLKQKVKRVYKDSKLIYQT